MYSERKFFRWDFAMNSTVTTARRLDSFSKLRAALAFVAGEMRTAGDPRHRRISETARMADELPSDQWPDDLKITADLIAKNPRINATAIVLHRELVQTPVTGMQGI